MFKKLIKATVAASLVATPMIAASAQAQHREVTTTRTVQQRGNGHTVVKQTTVTRQQPGRNWQKGQRFDRRYARNYRVVDYRQYRGQRLYAPSRGQQWVRSGNDALLIGRNGQIINVVRNAIR
jgi:Ni/Co efflux regulator RcnB